MLVLVLLIRHTVLWERKVTDRILNSRCISNFQIITLLYKNSNHVNFVTTCPKGFFQIVIWYLITQSFALKMLYNKQKRYQIEDFKYNLYVCNMYQNHWNCMWESKETFVPEIPFFKFFVPCCNRKSTIF